jgi:hypothetical protein
VQVGDKVGEDDGEEVGDVLNGRAGMMSGLIDDVIGSSDMMC